MDVSALLPGNPVWGQSYRKLFKITQVGEHHVSIDQ